MVKLGFIVEGDSEKIIIESKKFSDFLQQNNYQLVRPVVNAKGGGNLLPHNIGVFIKTLQKQKAEKICVLTDLEDEESVNIVRDRIMHAEIDEIFIAVKALEAWFLADTEAMRRWLEVDDFIEDEPENTPEKPWNQLKALAQSHNVRGPGSKVAFANKMIKHLNFDITHSAAHAQCPSAAELVGVLTTNQMNS